MNKKVKKILIAIGILFTAYILFNASSTLAATETYIENIYSDSRVLVWEYEVINNKVENLRIKSHPFNYMKQIELTIPSTINGLPVNSIGDGINRIINPETNQKHGGHDNMDTVLTEIEIPATVTEIHDYAFENCTRIQKVTFGTEADGTALKKIGNYAFRNNIYLSRIGPAGEVITCTLTIPNSVVEIGNGAFEIRCEDNFVISDRCVIEYSSAGGIAWSIWSLYSTKRAFATIKFGTGLQTIGEFAFSGNNALTAVTIPSTLNTIKKGAFAECRYINNITIEDRTTNLKVEDYAFSSIKSGLKSLVIPNKLTLGIGVYSNNDNLETVTIEVGGLKIPDYTFYNCSKLNKIIRNSNITKIGAFAFENCSSLTTVDYNNLVTNVTSIGEYAFLNCTGLTGELVITSNIKELYTGAFANCDNITEVNIKTTKITDLTSKLFYSCDNLEKVTKTSTIKYIHYSCFAECNSLTTNVVNEKILPNIKVIDAAAFANCKGLQGKLIMPSTLKRIEDRAFYNCNGINGIQLNGTIEKIGQEAFWGIGGEVFWEIGKTQEVIEIPASLYSIGARAFNGIREAYINRYSDDYKNRYYSHWNGNEDVIEHYLDCKHLIKVTCSLPGVKLINVNTGEEFTEDKYICRSTQKFRLVIEDGYSYPDLCIKLISEGQYASSELVEQYITLDENNEYTIENLIRGKEIAVLSNKNGTDLVLRQFITEINNKQTAENRLPKVSNNTSKASICNIEYKHSKYPLTVRKDDKIKYSIRVYNEGNKVGQVNGVKVYLQDGLELDESNEINTTNGWSVVEQTSEGTIIQTSKLKGKEIEAFSGIGKPQYEELEVVCKVTKEETNRLVSIAELSESNDNDTMPNTVKLSQLSGYMEEESYASESSSYIRDNIDSIDYENVEMDKTVKVGYTIVLNKIDSTSLELLNGAKFNLYDENKNLLETKATVNNGKLEFNKIITYGAGTDVYYIEEVETPAGYIKTLEGMLKLEVEKTIDDEGKPHIKVICDVKEREEEEQNVQYIPIETAEQLAKIGSDEKITIKGKEYTFKADANYQLVSDIDIKDYIGEDGSWMPIPQFSGIFEGNGKKISNLTIKYVENVMLQYKQVGLFAACSGTIRNVTLENVYINRSGGGDSVEGTSGQTAIGGFAGYMISGTIENCVVTGNISISINNVGGFIGHTVEGQCVKFKNCTNKANIYGNDNVGGLVGCAKGRLEISGCSNEGEITANSYNAGGLVGVAEPQGGSPENITVQFNETDKEIKIILKNKKIQNEYNLVLEKIDSLSNKYLNGAIFSLYDENMNPMNTEVTVTNGKITLDTITINSLKSDVFYIKEVQAPDGYEIQVKDYVRVCVNKKWNSDKEKYEISLTATIVNAKIENDSVDNTNTGNTVDLANEGNEYAVWRTSKVIVSNSSNSGQITSYASTGNSGGIAGIIAGITEISDCSNTGLIVGRFHLGGIVGELAGYKEGMTANIVRCSNGIEDSEQESNGWFKFNNGGATTLSVGGIVGFSLCNTTFDECNNYSNISAGAHVGGIIGLSIGKSIYMYNSSNTGNISTGGSNIKAGGLIGTQFTDFNYSINVLGNYVEEKTLKKQHVDVFVMNCSFNGNISSDGREMNIGGIIGGVDHSDNTRVCVQKCTVGNEDTQIMITTSGPNFIGGIIGRTNCDEIILSDNIVQNILMGASSVADMGGLVGACYNERYVKLSKIVAQNNTVKKVTLSTSSGGYEPGVAGLFGKILEETGRLDVRNLVADADIEIENCNVIDCEIHYSSKSQTNKSYQGYTSEAGLIGFANGKLNLHMNDCHVLNTNITCTDSRGCDQVAGLIGNLGVVNAKISNCDIKSTNPDKNGILNTGAGYTPTGGLIGFIYYGRDISICNSKIENMILSGKTGTSNDVNIGGIIGQTGVNSYARITLDGVEVVNVALSRECKDHYCSSGGLIGLIFDADYCEIKNSRIVDTKINAQNGSNMGAIIGINYYGTLTVIDNITINNVKLTDSQENSVSYTAIGGIIALDMGKSQITNSNINDLDIFTGSNTNAVGGIYGYTDGDSSIDNISITNLKIDDNMEKNVDASYEPCGGGLYGIINSGKIDITNINIDGMNIVTKYANIGGIIGFTNSNSINIENCNVKNSEIKVIEGEKDLVYGTKYGYCYSDLIALFVNYNANIILNDVSVENVNMNIEKNKNIKTHSGGLIGFTNGNVEITGSDNKTTIKNVKINNETTEGIVGGIIGLLDETSKAEISNVKVTDFTANGNNAIGGIIGCGIANIKNAIVTNMNTLVAEEGKELPSGVTAVGGIAGIAVEGSNIDNVTVTASEGKTSKLYSNCLAGGIAGVNSADSLKNSLVENIVVESKWVSEPEDENVEIITGISKVVSAIAAQYLNDALNCIVRNVTVINGTEQEVVNLGE